MAEAPIAHGDRSQHSRVALLSRLALISRMKGKKKKMYVKRLLPSIVTLIVLFFAASAFASTVSVDVAFAGNGSASGGAWSWAGGTSTLSASFKDAASINSNIITNDVIDVTTGPGEGGSGTLSNPFMFGPSAADSIAIGGCVDIGGTTTCGTLFTGTFKVGEVAYTGGGSTLDLTGVDVVGTLNSGLATSLGMNGTVIGSLAAVLDGTATATAGGKGFSGSGNLVLTSGPPPSPTPEPSELFLLGTGLFGLAAYLRTKHRT